MYNSFVLFYRAAFSLGDRGERATLGMCHFADASKGTKMRRLIDFYNAIPALALGLSCAFASTSALAQTATQQQIKQKQQAQQPGLTQARMAELKNHFYLADMDNDSSLQAGELASLLIMDGDHTKYSRTELKEIIASVDYNYSETMEENELLIYMAYTKPSPGPVVDEDTAYFNSFDEDGDGFVQLDELRQKMAGFDDSLTDQDISSAFKKNDFDRNEKLNHREFKMLMQSDD